MSTTTYFFVVGSLPILNETFIPCFNFFLQLSKTFAPENSSSSFSSSSPNKEHDTHPPNASCFVLPFSPLFTIPSTFSRTIFILKSSLEHRMTSIALCVLPSFSRFWPPPFPPEDPLVTLNFTTSPGISGRSNSSSSAPSSSNSFSNSGFLKYSVM